MVRTPAEFRSAYIGWCALYLSGFYLVWIAWRVRRFPGDAAILHIVGGRPKTELRAGVIDHMAFTGRDLPNTLNALDARGITHTCRRQVGSGTWQVFVHDLNGAKVELDFDASETAPGH